RYVGAGSDQLIRRRALVLDGEKAAASLGTARRCAGPGLADHEVAGLDVLGARGRRGHDGDEGCKYEPGCHFFHVRLRWGGGPCCIRCTSRREHTAGEWMEQEVLFVEEIVDPEIERETHGRVIVNLRIEHEVILEGSEQVRNGVIQVSNIACRCNAPRPC